jgi:hypothetical protein
MRFLRQIVRRFHQNISSQQSIRNEELFSHNNYETEYYLSAENHNEILNNIKLRHMQNDFKQLFSLNNQNNSKLLSDEIMRKIALMPNKLDPIW